MKDFLRDARRVDQEGADPRLVKFIQDVREICDDIQLVSNQVLEISGHRRRPGVRGFLMRPVMAVRRRVKYHAIAWEINSVRDRVSKIFEARPKYESRFGSILPRVHDVGARRYPKDDDARIVDEAYLAGIEEPKQRLISELLSSFHDQYSKVRVVSVVGMGGSGKTTLVQKVYDDVAVGNHFPICAWATVSSTWNSDEILRGLIRQVAAKLQEPTPLTLETMASLELKICLSGLLREKRYLVVFDDVWTKELWNEFRFMFPENGSTGGNRVMFTTRELGVAAVAKTQSHGHIHHMEMLSSENSWKLFCQQSFGNVDSFPEDLKAAATRILRICGGLPLGIVVIADHLASIDTNVTQWELVATRLEERCPVKAEDEMAGMLHRINETIALSYDGLTDKLKDCLLYTSIYSSGTFIETNILTMLLVAEGIAEPSTDHHQTASEIAWDYLRMLDRKSLIQLNQGRYNAPGDHIRIHDLVGAFIATRSNQENTATTIRTTEEISSWPANKKVSRLVLRSTLLDITHPESHLYSNHFRSIINFGRKNSAPEPVLTKLLSHAFSLTVLDLRGFPLREIPKQVFDLHLLTLLAVSGAQITTIPASIRNLEKLLFFILEMTSVRGLPHEITQLPKLCLIRILGRPHPAASSYGHFKSRGIIAPSGMGQLVELQLLHTLNVGESHESVVDDIGKLVKLRDLWLSNLREEDGQKLCASLGKLGKLHELLIASSYGSNNEVLPLDLDYDLGEATATCLESLLQLDLYGHLETIPRWIQRLHKLERITLSLSRSAKDPLEALQNLPNLSEVWLIEAYQGEVLSFEAASFPKLKTLNAKVFPNLKRVEIQKGAMRILNKLTIDSFPLLEELPEGIKHLSELQELNLLAINPQITNKLENEDDSLEYGKISHVPTVWIGEIVDERVKAHMLERNKKFQVQRRPRDTAGLGFTAVLIAFALFCLVQATLLSFNAGFSQYLMVTLFLLFLGFIIGL